ncbi:MAG: replication-associated recombination protein A [Candidatus Hydrogenedentes bacterium]|nr:replication-associated recombination protein A [Candidatus Hydrogenedentota bacterium]
MEEDLFGEQKKVAPNLRMPLARRVTPRNLDELIGQEEILGSGKSLRRAIESDCLTSLILWGPPGTGKTALARIIARHTKSYFEQVNAVTSNVKELRDILEKARMRLNREGKRTILFIDEIHRFNRAQQDALLPDVEMGYVILIGATTENPYFSVVSPLLSRSQIFRFRPLSEENIITIIKQALAHPNRGFDGYDVRIDEECFIFLARYAEGDARRALNALELALLTAPRDGNVIKIDVNLLKDCVSEKLYHYDGTGDEHYDIASAFIKSIRGGHPDSALYWMARMLEAGEPPRFIARRLCIAASEDVGNADPIALLVAVSAWQATEFIGMPEARIILAQAVTYLASAPKSNASYLAVEKALEMVKSQETVPVPQHLRDTHYWGAEKLGHGKGYEYPHDYEEGYIPQDYGLPRGVFYKPLPRGFEKQILERLKKWEEMDKTSELVKKENLNSELYGLNEKEDNK